MVAEVLSAVINKQAEQGWRYVRADTFDTPERRTWFHRAEPVAYTVLVFERDAPDAQPQQRIAQDPPLPALPAPPPEELSGPEHAPAARAEPVVEPTTLEAHLAAAPEQRPTGRANGARDLTASESAPHPTAPMVARRADERAQAPGGVRDTMMKVVDRARRIGT